MAFDELDALLAGASPMGGEDTQRPLVVVVDDDPIMRRSLQAVLESRYRVVLCSSAVEGVAAVTEDVCCVILDVKMKGYDGFWACGELRKRHAEVPVIFYSAYQDVKDPYEVINEHQPFGYITKDGTTGRLLAALDNAVRLYRITLSNKKLVASLERARRQRADAAPAPDGGTKPPSPR